MSLKHSVASCGRTTFTLEFKVGEFAGHFRCAQSEITRVTHTLATGTACFNLKPTSWLGLVSRPEPRTFVLRKRFAFSCVAAPLHRAGARARTQIAALGFDLRLEADSHRPSLPHGRFPMRMRAYSRTAENILWLGFACGEAGWQLLTRVILVHHVPTLAFHLLNE